MQAKDELGRYGESLAARMLSDRGYEILHRNWRCRQGELDIVAATGRTLVVCEVKTRRSNRFGAPAEAVHPGKANRIRSLTTQYLAAHPGRWQDIRFDVVSVLRPAAGPAQLQHLIGAF